MHDLPNAGHCRRAFRNLLRFATAALFAMPLSAPAQTNVTMRHNNNSRTGAYLNETALTTTTVTPAKFGRLYSLPVDGDLYAQPLYLSNIAIPGKGTHNVLYLATTHNSVYAYDADDAAGNVLWQVNLGPAVPQAFINSQNLPGEVGIISTPAIDTATNTIYVCTKDYFNNTIAFHLHALDLTTGADKVNPNGAAGSGVLIAAQVNGTGDGNDGNGHVPFVAGQHNQRAAVTLANGNVYLTFGAHEDRNPYHGWILSYTALSSTVTTLTLNGTHNPTPNGSEGGIWMSGEGLAVDGTGNLYYVGGNGTYDGNTNYGEAIVKLAPNTAMTDWFAPSNYDYLNSIDFDLSTSGVMIQPGTGYLISGSKAGTIYVIKPNNMTHFNAGGDQIVQEFQASIGHIHSSITYWNSPISGPTMYVWGERDYFKAFKYTNGAFNTTPISQSTMQVYPGYTNGPAVALSANGSTNGTGIVWATVPLDVDTINQHGHGAMRAFDANDLSHELWNSLTNAGDDLGDWAKFNPPIIVAGKVYAASFNHLLHVYGILPAQAPPAPTNPAALGTSGLVTLAWDNMPRTASYNLLRSTTAGGPYTAIATGLAAHSYNDTTVVNGTKYYYRVVSVNAYGTAQSAEVGATPNAPAPSNGDGLLANYYPGNNPDWSPEAGTVFLNRIDGVINFNVDNGNVAYNPTAWPAGVPHDNYTAVWTGQFLAPYTGSYQFQTITDDGARLSIGGAVLFNYGVYQGPTANTSGTFSLTAGQKIALKLEYFQGVGGATAQLLYAYGNQAFQIIPQTLLYSGITAPPAGAPVLSAAPGNTTVVLSWSALPTAASYVVKRSATAGGTYTTVASNVYGVSYRDTGLTNGATYYYKVAGANSIGIGPDSNVASAVPVNAVFPVAWWRFEDGTAGNHVAAAPYTIPDFSGSGNTLQTFADGTAPTYRADNAGNPTNPIAVNALSVDFTQAPNGYATRDLYTGGATGDLNTHVFNQFTIETSVKFAGFGGYQTFLGKDGYQIPGSADANLSSLYLQSPDPGSVGNRQIISFRTHQADGAFVIVNGTTPLTTGKWYNVAAVSDGTTLKLYLQTTPGGAYSLEGSQPFVGQMALQNRTWTIGRGMYGNNTGDQFHGQVDEVRICDTALDPTQFLYAPAAAVSGRIALRGVPDLTAVNAAAPLGTFLVQFRTPGTTTAVYGTAVSLSPVGTGSAFGKYTVGGVPPGTYDVAIKGSKNLRVLLKNVAVSGSTALADVTLPAGDADSNNTVDIGDFGILVNAYGGQANAAGSGYDPTADFDYNGVVDIGDFGLLVNEYGNSGSP